MGTVRRGRELMNGDVSSFCVDASERRIIVLIETWHVFNMSRFIAVIGNKGFDLS